MLFPAPSPPSQRQLCRPGRKLTPRQVSGALAGPIGESVKTLLVTPPDPLVEHCCTRVFR
ncbi:MAG TPA: hypothetical protein PLF54_07425 [Deltaproteobacteria bacterium]|nr:hypothetical protein [Deltaproteobacteria bacterium]